MAGDVARLAVLVELADTGSKENGANQRGNAADHVHHRGTGEIMEAELGEPAIGIPAPMAGNRVYDRGNDGAVNQIRSELRTFRHCSGNDGGAGRAEHRLEHQVHGCGHEAVVLIGAHHEEIRVSDDAADGRAEHQTETDDPIQNRTDAIIGHVLHGDVSCILGTGEAGFQHGETGLHHEYQNGGDQCPNYVCRRHGRHFLPLLRPNAASMAVRRASAWCRSRHIGTGLNVNR